MLVLVLALEQVSFISDFSQDTVRSESNQFTGIHASNYPKQTYQPATQQHYGSQQSYQPATQHHYGSQQSYQPNKGYPTQQYYPATQHTSGIHSSSYHPNSGSPTVINNYHTSNYGSYGGGYPYRCKDFGICT